MPVRLHGGVLPESVRRPTDRNKGDSSEIHSVAGSQKARRAGPPCSFRLPDSERTWYSGCVSWKPPLVVGRWSLAFHKSCRWRPAVRFSKKPYFTVLPRPVPKADDVRRTTCGDSFNSTAFSACTAHHLSQTAFRRSWAAFLRP